MNTPAKILLAPMMDITDRHCRYFLRQFSKHLQLYTEMVTTQALIHGDTHRLLQYHSEEHPLCLQLGGNNPKALAQCARWAEEAGYDEINLNVGCPSDRVQAGQFGLCLMKTPARVAESVAAMKAAVRIPISVKTRIGYDHEESEEALQSFIHLLCEAGVNQVTLHARKGWLSGLSPKENRTIPPLRYEVVYRIKQAFPFLSLALNGGVLTLDEAASHLQHVDSVMIGRAGYQHPYLFAEIDSRFHNEPTPPPSREAILTRMHHYALSETKRGVPLRAITRHMMGLYYALPNAKAWRQMCANPTDFSLFLD